MLQEDIATSLHSIISSMYNPQTETITLEDATRNITVKINLKNGAMMNFDFTQHKEKDKVFSIKTADFPIYAYHNSIARLAPIYDQLLFLGKHPTFANPDLIMSFAATVSNVTLMLGEQSLIKTENSITDILPQNLKNDVVIICGPISEYFVFTIHFVKPKNTATQLSFECPTFWHQFAPETVFPHLGHEYIVVDSVMLKTKSKTQTKILSELKAFQMLLSSISTNLAVEAEERDEEEEEEND
ncbi:hypothetical protein TRFO_06689 [Tritrichomonas foetus]|uniref:Uncharacterized protein n=1 Tax=Tritrichomonas foetus TaxID=1144522 RepID=A0A1J4K1U4_9EUKA|nr:hypothetical protein TRFO_06689 [Tritrichomonas foetus]|eukprot:OHT03445.1 hypothetical protein TRFO_06689 [Tritrichomonas foetus]